MRAATTDKNLVGIKPRCGRGPGRIIAAGMTEEVTFEPVDGPINDRIKAVTGFSRH
jgi:hypothetical protein